ncbi:MAG: hypothetical protein ACI4IS_02210 [Acutalibacteraceae bacterium]
MKSVTANRIVIAIGAVVFIGGFILGSIYGVPDGYYSSSTKFNAVLMLTVWISGTVCLVLPCALIAGLIESVNKIAERFGVTIDSEEEVNSQSQNNGVTENKNEVIDNSDQMWVCPKCGRSNHIDILFCGCGEQKPQEEKP